MAPEQAAGKKEVGPAADIWSLGAILYECLTGRPPFRAATAFDTLLQVMSDEPVPISQLNPRVPVDLDTIALKTLQKIPRNRYATARHLADDLGRFLAGEPIHARPISSLERLYRWCKKRPAVAALLTAVFLLLAVVAGVSSIAYVKTDRARAGEAEQRRAAELAETTARTEQREADRQRKAALAAEKQARDEATRSRRLLYASDMQLAAQMWASEHGIARRIDELLAGWTGPGEDLREWSWRYQWGLLHGAPGMYHGLEGPLRGAWRADGKLVTIDSRQVLRCWDVTGGKEVARADLRQGDEAVQLDLAASGSSAAVLTNKGVLRLVDPTTGQARHTIEVPGGKANTVALTPDGKRVIVRRDSDGTAWVWNTATGQLSDTLARTAEEFGEALALSPDGTTLASRTGAGLAQVALVDLQKKTRRGPLVANATLRCLAFSPDGKQLAGGNHYGRLLLWDVATLEEKMRLPVHLGFPLCLGFSADGKRLACGTYTGLVTVTDLAGEETLFYFKGHTTPITFVSLSPDGKWLASGSIGGTVRVWSLTQAEVPGGAEHGAGPHLLWSGRGVIEHVSCSPDGKWIAAVQGDKAAIWDTQSRKIVRRLTAPLTEKQRPVLKRLAFTADSKTLAAGGHGGAIHLWNAETGQHIRTLKDDVARSSQLQGNAVAALSFSPDGRYLAVGHGAHTTKWGNHEQFVRVWDMRSGQVVSRLPHENYVFGVFFSADGKTLLTGSADGNVRVWSVPTWKLGKTWTVPDRIRSLALSPGGDLVAAGLDQGVISVLEIATGKQTLLLKEHLRMVVGLAFTPDGKTLVSASQDHTVRLWHLASGRSLRALREHDDFLTALAITPDGNAIVSSSWDGVLRLWQAPSAARIEAIRKTSRKR
jgi:WD40 repeat protein